MRIAHLPTATRQLRENFGKEHLHDELLSAWRFEAGEAGGLSEQFDLFVTVAIAFAVTLVLAGGAFVSVVPGVQALDAGAKRGAVLSGEDFADGVAVAIGTGVFYVASRYLEAIKEETAAAWVELAVGNGPEHL